MSVSIFFFLCHVKYSVVSLELVFTCWLSSILVSEHFHDLLIAVLILALYTSSCSSLPPNPLSLSLFLLSLSLPFFVDLLQFILWIVHGMIQSVSERKNKKVSARRQRFNFFNIFFLSVAFSFQFHSSSRPLWRRRRSKTLVRRKCKSPFIHPFVHRMKTTSVHLFASFATSEL